MADTTNTTAASGAAFQSEALRCAEWLEHIAQGGNVVSIEGLARTAAAELRNLHTLTTAAPAAQEAEPAGIRLLSNHEIHEAYQEACRRTDAALGIHPESSATGRDVRPEHLLHIGRVFEEAAFRKLRPWLDAAAQRPQADAGAPTAVKVTQDMRRVFREAYRVGGFWADRLDYALDRMLAAAAPQAPAAPDMESVLIDGVAYQTPAPVAAELLRLHLEAMQAPAAPATPNCARCQGSGEDPEGYYDQSKGDAGHTHDGPCRDCSGTGEAPAAPTAAAANSVAAFWKSVDDGTVVDDISPETWGLIDKLVERRKAAGDGAWVFEDAQPPAAAEGAYAPLPKPYSAAAALGLDDLYTGDDMRAYADAHRATPAPAAGAVPIGTITQPYTVAEIRERVASGDYSAELMLQHALLHLGAGAAPTDAEIADVSIEYVRMEPLSDFDSVAFARWGATAPAQEAKLRAEVDRLNAIINTPQADDFLRAVSTEAEHQRQRWPSEHDAGKAPADWFWLVGYLAGKALHAHAAGNAEKAEHHIITTAAALANWHLAVFGKTNMRPGIDARARQEGGAA